METYRFDLAAAEIYELFGQISVIGILNYKVAIQKSEDQCEL